MPKIERPLIIGGAGFIGANVADRLLHQGASVTILDNFSRRGTPINARWLQERYPGRVHVVTHDIRHPGKILDDAVAACDAVFHFAGQVALTDSVVNPREDFECNAVGSFNVLEAIRTAPHHPPILYTSTNKVYGKLADLQVIEQGNRSAWRDHPYGVDESRPIDFNTPYGCSKGAADQYVLGWADTYGIPAVVFRQSCIYGGRQFSTEGQGWVAWIADRAKTGKEISIFGDGKQTRDVLFIDDLVDAMLAALANIDRTAGQAYNIGGGPDNTLSILELVDLLSSKLGRNLPVRYEQARPGDQKVFIADVRKAADDFGWKPTTSPEKGAERLLEWLDVVGPLDALPENDTASVSTPAAYAMTSRVNRRTTVSIVIPAKDESATLGRLLDNVRAAVKNLSGYEIETVVVDDHSVDGTAKVAVAHGARVVSNERTPGKGHALRTGFESCTSEILVMMDADYSHRPEELPEFLRALEDPSVGLVIGSRVAGGSDEYTPIRAFGNLFLTGMVGICFGRYLSDALNGYKAFRRQVFTDFEYTSHHFEIEIELIANALRRGDRVVEVLSHERLRAGGKAKSRVIKHGTLFLTRILHEWRKGVRVALQS